MSYVFISITFDLRFLSLYAKFLKIKSCRDHFHWILLCLLRRPPIWEIAADDLARFFDRQPMSCFDFLYPHQADRTTSWNSADLTDVFVFLVDDSLTRFDSLASFWKRL